jgi:hypothetical protein
MGVSWEDAPVSKKESLIDGLMGYLHFQFIRKLLTKRCRYRWRPAEWWGLSTQSSATISQRV